MCEYTQIIYNVFDDNRKSTVILEVFSFQQGIFRQNVCNVLKHVMFNANYQHITKQLIIAEFIAIYKKKYYNWI